MISKFTLYFIWFLRRRKKWNKKYIWLDWKFILNTIYFISYIIIYKSVKSRVLVFIFLLEFRFLSYSAGLECPPGADWLCCWWCWCWLWCCCCGCCCCWLDMLLLSSLDMAFLFEFLRLLCSDGPKKNDNSSMGSGNTIVEFFSAAILLSVCR